jgi:hypothetical protein
VTVWRCDGVTCIQDHTITVCLGCVVTLSQGGEITR